MAVLMKTDGCTCQADLQGIVNVLYTQMFNQQEEDREGILGQIRGI